MLGDRITTVLYEILDELLIARYSSPKLTQLKSSNIKLEILRYQTRLLFDFNLISTDRYEYIQRLLNEIGLDLGGWIKQQEKLTLNNL